METQKIGDLKKALENVEIRDNFDKGTVNHVIAEVYDAMREKGYNPVNQFVGYIISGEPTYITSYKDARKKMAKLDRDELLEEIVNFYLNNNL
jgi:uncharacterized protein (UPF0297 family)